MHMHTLAHARMHARMQTHTHIVFELLNCRGP